MQRCRLTTASASGSRNNVSWPCFRKQEECVVALLPWHSISFQVMASLAFTRRQHTPRVMQFQRHHKVGCVCICGHLFLWQYTFGNTEPRPPPNGYIVSAWGVLQQTSSEKMEERKSIPTNQNICSYFCHFHSQRLARTTLMLHITHMHRDMHTCTMLTKQLIATWKDILDEWEIPVEFTQDTYHYSQENNTII